ncbi:hypothetical protein BKA67DRAFT_520701 [Truncatella angustata]|uniref:Glycosyltransferase family 28 N-terminal domain-containing protein n=1 Tax=Truncatella angustata TaxID=152316 RepID=A0A9P8ZWQ8_9PEZI|nr:uncharacterized protein BKA67DRAFT_520701 [Truncatella angustata]KAH6652352.1 hypothetical protein BKA67DRAFT_520701 [Truncatella angustata]
MPFKKLNSDNPSRFSIGDDLARTTTEVNNDGRATVQFHRNPSDLAAWFKRVHDNTISQPERKVFAARKGSDAFLNDKDSISAGPRLNIAIHIVGSRGDVQPFIPIALLLTKPPYRHRVRICTHPVFKDFVEGKGLEFFSIGGDPEALMAYMVKNPGLFPSRESVKAGDIGKRRKEMASIMDGAWRSCIEAGDGMGDRVVAADVQSTKDLFIADAIIANPPSMAHIHCAEKLGVPLHMVFTMPWSPTHTFHHPLAAMQYGQAETSTANYLSFIMMELLTWQGLGDVINKFRTRTLKLDPISPLWGHQLLSRLRLPFTYLWSESLIPKPSDWGPNIHIAGFSFLSQALSYTPPSDLESFLNAGPPPIYIGFGSIVVEDSQALTKLIFDAVELAQVRAIVSKGWGGIGAGVVPDNIYLIGDCPHDWLFQKVSCVVHHGGAGTTAAGLAAGCSTVVVPFFGDQPFWGQMIARAGAGPEPVSFKKMTAQSLANSIRFAVKPEVQAAAKKVALQIAEEDGAGNAAKEILSDLDSADLKCDICPNRLAVYTHKKTGAHISSFAAYCLANAGVIKVQDLRLLRHKHWYVDEGAESVGIGIVAAVSSFFVDIAMATQDYKGRLQAERTSNSRRKSTSLPSSSESHDGSPLENTGSRAGCFPASHLTPKQLEKVSKLLATQPTGDTETLFSNEVLADSGQCPRAEPTWLIRLREKDDKSQMHLAFEASGQYVSDLARAGLKAPITLLYNTANGFRNSPSYISADEDVRRRDEIKGLKSGFKTAGKESVLGFYDAFSGLILRPYKGAKKRGILGFGKGVGLSIVGLVSGIGTGIFSLPGYSLKGIEKALHKRRLTDLKAEMLLIRIRQGIEECRLATGEERHMVTARWKSLYPT